MVVQGRRLFSHKIVGAVLSIDLTRVLVLEPVQLLAAVDVLVIMQRAVVAVLPVFVFVILAVPVPVHRNGAAVVSVTVAVPMMMMVMMVVMTMSGQIV